MTTSINANFADYVQVDTNSMTWSASPSPTVWRKRLHLVGPPESGQVTSVVRYDAGATFPPHDHPDGEEILVLDGVFSDEYGDWPAGTYLLNPQGFRHAPYSENGCVLFVKLRQYAGLKRKHIAIQSKELDWQSESGNAKKVKLLYQQAGFADSMWLERWAAQSQASSRWYPDGAELFVIAGEFHDETGKHSTGSWLRFPSQSTHSPYCNQGCTVYVKYAGLSS